MSSTKFVTSQKGIHLSNDKNYVFYKKPYLLEIQFKESFTFEEFKDAILQLQKEANWNYERKFWVEFQTDAKIFIRGKWRRTKKIALKFFIASNGSLCYTNTSRTGYYLEPYLIEWNKTKRIYTRHYNHPKLIKEKNDKKKKFEKRLQKEKYDEKTWTDLTADSFYNGYKFYYLNKVFSSNTLKEIEKHFENKTEFCIKTNSPRRNYTVNGKMCDDGIYRAWFSSEYRDCKNGDYYLLLNPKLAVYSETD